MPKGSSIRSGARSSSKTVGGSIGGRDARTGLGYGILEPKFQLPRQSGGQFPYSEPDDVPDADIDDETLAAVGKKSPNYEPTDSYAQANPFYFVGGNTKLSDCFWRIDKVLNEVAASTNSMTAIPGYYKGMGPSLGGSGAAFPSGGSAGGNAKRTGSTQGWSHAPPETELEANAADEETNLDSIFTLKDLARKKMKQDGEVY